jgi:hypothetical protein
MVLDTCRKVEKQGKLETAKRHQSEGAARYSATPWLWGYQRATRPATYQAL